MSVSSPAPSPRGALSVSDLVKLVRDAAIAGAAVALAHFAERLPSVDLGPYSDVLIPIIVVLLSAVRRYLAGPRQAAPKS